MFNEVACDGAHSDSTESNTKSPKEELRVLFGREDLSEFYRTAMNKFFELKMNKLSELIKLLNKSTTESEYVPE